MPFWPIRPRRNRSRPHPAARWSLVAVEAGSGSEASALAGLDIAALPSVVVVIAPDPGCLPSAAFPAADIVLTEDFAASAPFIAPTGGVEGCLSAISTTLAANPVAGTALPLLLRTSAGLTVPAALIAESAAYSALQEDAEFRNWRSARPVRPPEADTVRVRVARSDAELRITLARPARRNAVDWRMRDALAVALATAIRDRDLPVVLAGDGPDFCAGGDLDQFGSRPDPAIGHLIRLTRCRALLLHRLSARTTAYVHGACLGAGIELPTFAGKLIAAEDSRFALLELRIGLVPGAGGTASLPRRIGHWRTAFLGLSGQSLSAYEALRWGLVDAIDPRGPVR